MRALIAGGGMAGLMTALSLVLGATGVYGVVAHYATRRRRDWAIRVALGLPGTRVVSRVVRHGAVLVATGVVAGWAGAALLTRLLSSFLYGVSAVDSVAFAAAGAALLAVDMLVAMILVGNTSVEAPLFVTCLLLIPLGGGLLSGDLLLDY